MKNLFLTGKQGVGKTTLLNKLLAREDEHCLSSGTIGGYYTECALHAGARRFWLEDRVTGERCEMAAITGRGTQVNLSAFDDFAVRIITRPCGLLALDELGRFEEPCEAFKSAVHAALDGDTTVLGVLKLCDTPFVRSVIERADVTVITVTEQNRDVLFDVPAANWRCL
jgi:nucleoside-triphosphatase